MQFVARDFAGINERSLNVPHATRLSAGKNEVSASV